MKPSIVLIPGLAADASTWTAQLEVFPGALVSDVHFRNDTLPAMAAALLAEHEGGLVLCGASMGGMVALECQRQAPERVHGLALLGSSARPDTPEIAALRANAFEMIDAGRFDEMIAMNVPFSFHADRLAERELTQAYVDMLLRAGAAQLVRQNLAVAARPDSRPLLPAVACPTLVLCGDADLVTPLEHSREIAAAVPGAELVVIERCGHMLTMERPDEVNAALRRWLAALGATR
ncbi:MAG TPA: alpha/beta fold hydrolase [Burkholderiaceae bacterium]|nr:alpha/beta fold hydrolase [Burkholderiaceae bacterium]